MAGCTFSADIFIFSDCILSLEGSSQLQNLLWVEIWRYDTVCIHKLTSESPCTWIDDRELCKIGDYKISGWKNEKIWPLTYFLFVPPLWKTFFSIWNWIYDGLFENMQKESEDVHTIQFHILSLMIKCKNIYPSR